MPAQAINMNRITCNTARSASQALRLDESAASRLTDSSMAVIASMGNRMRQLALLGLQYVSDSCLSASLSQLTMLQVWFMSQQGLADKSAESGITFWPVATDAGSCSSLHLGLLQL
jgi:hypothetical protein